ncbi:hypothetical protein LCGC14_1971580 [marine sediment metagenome]|uniref:HD domain-containing protein n=1 Tax=marine sediment metagenome TaxID=412755 RepID=A0A0F9FC40_9ZZZZ|nr:HD domain-containing protein [archaeon]
MIEQEMCLTITQFSKDKMGEDVIHGFSHVKRVLNSCLNIGKKLNANLIILEISALLHDIGRKHENKGNMGKNHAEISAGMALNFLTSRDFKLSQEEIDNIIHSIRSHSFSNIALPNTLEAKILSDADKLDALGAIGLFRTIGFAIKKGAGLEKVINHLERKILKLKDQMNLPISKKLAEERNQIILDFYRNIRNEI